MNHFSKNRYQNHSIIVDQSTSKLHEKLTAKTDPACAIQAKRPIGMQAAISDAVKLGTLRMPVVHVTILQIIPTRS